MEEMDTITLFSLAVAYKNRLIPVQDAVRRKLSSKTLVFRSPYNSNNRLYSESNVDEFDDRIEIRNEKMILDILREFSPLISKLHILHEREIYPDITRNIFRMINAHCAESLHEIQIYETYDIFWEFKKPFLNVERVSIGGKFHQLTSSILRFVDIFPAMRELILNTIEVKNSEWLNCNYPMMEKLTVKLYDNRGYWGNWRPFNETCLKQLIRSNTQIHHLRVENSTPQLLKFIGDELPHLQNFTFTLKQ